MLLFIYISVCLEAHVVPYGGVPPGITVCLARDCLQASAGVNGVEVGGGGGSYTIMCYAHIWFRKDEAGGEESLS